MSLNLIFDVLTGKWVSAIPTAASKKTGLTGTDGNDNLTGTDASETIQGGKGNDIIDARGGNDKIYGGDGNDILMGDWGNDLFDGGAGVDTVQIDGSQVGHLAFDINLTTGRDQYPNTYVGIENVIGGAVNDVLTGDAQANLLDGRAGNDTLRGMDGHDALLGGNGNDLLEGGNGNDLLEGQDGDDRLLGGNGDDILNGGNGNDVLDPGAGNNVVDGGAGTNTLNLAGRGFDYIVSRNSDGSYSFVNASGTTTVRNVQNVWFEGEQVMRPIEQTISSVNINDGRSADIDHVRVGPSGVQELSREFEDGDIRDVSGRFNNQNNPEFGAANEPFIRISDVRLGTDGAPRGVVNGVQTLPNERDISNVIVNQDENGDGIEEKTTSVHDTNLFLMTFGQFFDHGLDFLARSPNAADSYTIALKPGDPLYRFSDDGNPANDITSITLRRGEKAIDPNTGLPFTPLAHINKTSPFIDKNQAYGSSEAVTYYLRESKRDANGNVVYDANGQIVKLASMAHSGLDAQGRPNLPTYYDILINNGMSKADIAAAVAANSFSMLQMAKGYVDHRNVIDPKTGQPDGNPILLDSNPAANPLSPSFKLTSLLDHRIGGDGRANENIMLTSVHEVFFRDHEHWVDVLREKTGNSWTEDKYFETAKQIVESEYQRVIFDEFIDALAGSLPGPIPHGFDGYHPRVDAQISEEFAHAIYRVGHSMITEKIPFVDSKGQFSQMSLVEAFLNPQKFEDLGSTGLIKGQTMVAHERIDENLVNAVRNQLLGQASDLGAINIARGREVGLPSLNEIRKMLYERGSAEVDNGSDVTRALKGNPELKPYSSWDEFAKNLRDPSLVELFKKVYKSVDDVDVWVGGLAEKPRSQEEGQMGTTFTWIFWEQMDRLQDGDRFYYKGRFADTEILGMLETQTFADIIMRTTDNEFLADKVFFLSNEVRMGLTEKARTFTSANETIVGNALDNEIRAGAGDDTVYGGAGNDKIWGEDGNDGIRGEDGSDVIYAGQGDDRVAGGDGNDLIFGGGEQDALNGNAGNDSIYGEDGDDEVHGNEGDDALFGGNGNDVIKGGIGNDTLYGDAGNDRMEANGGTDFIWTGSGRDVVLMSDDAGRATVMDFDLKSDRVDLQLFDMRNWADVKARLTMIDTVDGVLLKMGNAETLLKGVKANQLTQDHFKFENDDRNLVINGRMDEGRIEVRNGDPVLVDPIESGDWAYLSNEKSTGWKNQNDDRVEYQRVNGNIALELDADKKVDEIYQLLPTRKGEVYTLSFDAIENGGVSTSTIEVLWNGVVVAKFDPAKAWATYTFEVTGTGGKDRLAFREDAGDNNSNGALIDNVIVAPKDNKPEVFEYVGNDNGQVYVDRTGMNESIDGKGGIDTFTVQAKFAGFEIKKGNDGSTTVSKGTEVLATLRNIEIIKFADVTYKQDANGNWKKDGDNTINGTDGDDWLPGTDGDDTILGGKGFDGLAGGKGNDILDGGEGYDEVILPGKPADYTFTKNADGTYTVKNATEGTDTLISIDAIWFEGSQELRTLADLVKPGNPGTTIKGTDGDDWLPGTDGDDTILGGKGFDGLAGGKGDDILDGGEGYDEAILPGKPADYTFTKNADGTYTVKSATQGTDKLISIDAVWFEGSQELRKLTDLVNPGNPGTTITGTDGDDWLPGTDGNDTILGGKGYDGLAGGKGDDILDGGEGYDEVILSGKASDYTFTKNADGSYTVKSAVEGTDKLISIDAAWFEGSQQLTKLTDLVPEAPEIPNNQVVGTDGDDWLPGTDGKDTILGGKGYDGLAGGKGDDILDGGEGYDEVILSGKASDYTFTKNADGTYTVKSAVEGTDKLISIDAAWFEGSQELKTLAELSAPAAMTNTAMTNTAKAATATVAATTTEASATNVAAKTTEPTKTDPATTKTTEATTTTEATKTTEAAKTADVGTTTAATKVAGVPDNAFFATDGDDWLPGTDGDDVIFGGKGNDTFAGTKGNDLLNGGEGVNQLDLTGKVEDYTFARNADGSYTVSSAAEGVDVLQDIQGVWFEGSLEFHAVDQLANV